MRLKVINSNSLGNCYLLIGDKETLIIECGVPIDEIKQAVNYNFKKVVGAVVTHNHQDHCKSINKLMAMGVTVWASFGTHGALNTLNFHRAAVCKHGDVIYCGDEFKIMPFDIKHDVPEPLGFLIHHEECGTVLFLTDSYYSEYTFKGLNNIIIEANYCQKILDRRLQEGVNPKFLRDRVIQSHMSLETCKNFLQANDLSQVNNIVLIHLSDGNSDAARFKREVAEATGKVVNVAVPGLNIPFNKNLFNEPIPITT